MKRRLAVGPWNPILAVGLAFGDAPTGSYAAALKLGAMGDSLTDEYWDMGDSATYATNWPGLVVMFRGVDIGLTAAQAGTDSWGSPRNHGYESSLPLQTVVGDGSTQAITNAVSATSQRFYRLTAH